MPTHTRQEHINTHLLALSVGLLCLEPKLLDQPVHAAVCVEVCQCVRVGVGAWAWVCMSVCVSVACECVHACIGVCVCVRVPRVYGWVGVGAWTIEGDF